MVVLREVNGIELNVGDLNAKGFFNVSTEDDVSIWFDGETKDELMESDDGDFEESARQLLKI